MRTASRRRSEEHTSELQSLIDLVCRLLLEKKNSRGRGSSTGRGWTRPRRRSVRSVRDQSQGGGSPSLARGTDRTHSEPVTLLFFLKDPGPPEIYPLPLHDPLPI